MPGSITLRKALVRARDAADGLVETLLEVNQWADTLFREMDFTFLYDEQRHLFSIGYDRRRTRWTNIITI